METTPTFVVLGGPEDATRLDKADESGRRLRYWICAKSVQRGDRLLIYLWRPEHKIAATAIADHDARQDETGRYRTTLRDVCWLEQAITLHEMRDQLPHWRWTVNCSTRCRVPGDIAEWLWQISKRPTAATSKRGTNKRSKAKSKSKTKANRGAGFGRAEMNRIVEQAAVARVTEDFCDKGFSVTSRENEHVGYDLDVSNNRDELHVEVKGVSGNLPEFMITSNELACSKSDRAFHMCVVTNAASDHAEIHSFTAKELHSRFGFHPVTYRAKPK